ncbi:MAG: hypothetical protein ACRDRR_00495 [Pseudonocardiaceae bacterium]
MVVVHGFGDAAEVVVVKQPVELTEIDVGDSSVTADYHHVLVVYRWREAQNRKASGLASVADQRSDEIGGHDGPRGPELRTSDRTASNVTTMSQPTS